MLYLPKQGYLSQGGRGDPIRLHLQLDLLERHTLLRLGVLCLVDDSVGPIADQTDPLVAFQLMGAWLWVFGALLLLELPSGGYLLIHFKHYARFSESSSSSSIIINILCEARSSPATSA